MFEKTFKLTVLVSSHHGGRAKRFFQGVSAAAWDTGYV
jgi:hypothetical protein